MIEPLKAEKTKSQVGDNLRSKYNFKKDEYLDLCGQYNLPPKDVNLLLMENSNMGASDRVRLIRLIILLADLEKLLGPNSVEEFLFAADESKYLHSGVFRNNLH